MVVVQRQQRGGGSEAGEVVEYLQLAGQRYREHVELLRQEQAAREAQHAPFRPNISAHAERIGKTSVARQEASIGVRLHELHQKRLALIEEEAQEDARRRAAHEVAECSFAPAISARAAHARRSDGDVTGALMRWGEQQRARQARAQLEATRTELSTVSAAPRISAYAAEKARAERSGVPVEVSLMAEAEARRQRRQAAFEQAYPASASCSDAGAGVGGRRAFSPAISAHAAHIDFAEDVVSRLYDRHTRRTRSATRPPLFDETAALHCTFAPQLSAQSAALSRQYHAAEGEADADPYERLHRNPHHASRFRKPAAAPPVTGQPAISEASRRIVEERRRQLALAGDPAALGSSPGSRLYPGSADATADPAPKPATHKKKVVTARDVEAQAPLTFAPSVSAASESLWRRQVAGLQASGAARSAEEARQLLWRRAETRRTEAVRQALEERRRQEAEACTFRPKAGRPPHRRAGYANMSVEERTTLWAQQRERRLAELRNEADETAAEVCSFQPRIDPVFPLPRGDARPAWGVETFLERQAAARRQRAEAAQWWRPQYARTPVEDSGTSMRTASRASQPRQRRSESAAVRSEAASSRASPRADEFADPDEAQEAGDAEEEEDVFEQHWVRPPPSTSLTASSFSRVSQPDVPSAESSPPSYVVRQPPAAASARGAYVWRAAQRAAPVDSGAAAPPWRPPLRYRPLSATARGPASSSGAL